MADAADLNLAGPIIDPRRRYQARAQGFDVTNIMPYEHPLEDPTYAEVWFYTDRLSYRPGDEVAIHASSTVPSFTVELQRDGAAPTPAETIHDVRAPLSRLRPGFIEQGCDWPVVCRWTIPNDAPSGFYIATARAADAAGNPRVQEHGFFVRPAHGADTGQDSARRRDQHLDRL